MDSKIVVRHVRNTIHCLSLHIKGYQLEVWNLIMHFNAFNINAVPRLQNIATDLLTTSASRLVPTNNKCSIELIFKPSVLDNVTNVKVFNDDEKIINFLMNEESFKESIIDEEKHLLGLKNEDAVKGNFMHKAVRTLKWMFDLHSKLWKLANVKTNNSSMLYELVNQGSKSKPKYVNLGKCCSPRERCKFIKLFQQYKYIFTWMNEDLKNYDTCII